MRALPDGNQGFYPELRSSGSQGSWHNSAPCGCGMEVPTFFLEPLPATKAYQPFLPCDPVYNIAVCFPEANRRPSAAAWNRWLLLSLTSRVLEKRIHSIWSGPPTLKDKGLNRACTSGDEDLGALLGVLLHTFPYYPTEQIASLKFLNFPGGLSPSPPCKQTLDCILLLITLEPLQDQSFQLPEPERCLFFLQLFAPWLIAGETRNLKDAGIFWFIFSSCPRHHHACVLHWHANTTQSNDLPQGLRRTPWNSTSLNIFGQAVSAVLHIGDPEFGSLRVDGEAALFVNRTTFSA